jgi:hypothetical protein
LKGPKEKNLRMGGMGKFRGASHIRIPLGFDDLIALLLDVTKSADHLG